MRKHLEEKCMKLKILMTTWGLFPMAIWAGVPYLVVDTAQSLCYDSDKEVPSPARGSAFFGQDAQHPNHKPAYSKSVDGLTVKDEVTGLTWQSSPKLLGLDKTNAHAKLTLTDALKRPAELNARKFGGFDDWRLPTIKELYSLILFSGIDASGPFAADASGARPFIDTNFFDFAYGDTSAGERVIDSQWVSCTVYAGNKGMVFGVNFADGRIKGYGTNMPGRGAKTFFAVCVRGNPAYGHNDFHDNGDCTVTDRATGLVWSQSDSGVGMDWASALAWVAAKNSSNYLGHSDWRLPNAKELQSIVDYGRSPDTTGSAAIDPVFGVTSITNENGKLDYPFYWTSTTHAGHEGKWAVYIAFGRASGWVNQPSGNFGPPAGAERGGPPPDAEEFGPPDDFAPPLNGDAEKSSTVSEYRDVHGAGAQRSDPKKGDSKAFTRGFGPQGDVIRINNFVRMVRGE